MHFRFIIVIIIAFFALSNGFSVRGGRGGKGARRAKRRRECMKRCEEDLSNGKDELVKKHIAQRIAENPQYVIADSYRITISCPCPC